MKQRGWRDSSAVHLGEDRLPGTGWGAPMAKMDVVNVSSAVSPGDTPGDSSGPWAPPQTRASSRLTKRQRAVLAELATGASLKVMASNLSISVATVSTHLYRAKRKLDAASRNDLLATLVGASAKHYRVPLSIRCRATKAELATCEAIIEGKSYGALARARGSRYGRCSIRLEACSKSWESPRAASWLL